MATVNEFGKRLDRNGYAASILQKETDTVCFIDGCNCTQPLHRHEIFHGANRKKSKNLGCWVTLCYRHHTGIHNGLYPELDKELRRMCQTALMQKYRLTIFDFIQRFGKNYL